MTDGDAPRKPGEIIYHFDVDRSSIPLAQFIDSARATQEIMPDLFDESRGSNDENNKGGE